MNSLYSHHIPTSHFQRFLLGISSAIVAFKNPYRDDMVAVCGETTACQSLEKMRNAMLQDKNGKRILKDKPRISSSTVDLKILKSLPPNTFGRQYVDMLDKYRISPDSRKEVKFVDDIELAYVLQRYREVHDFNHLILSEETNLLGEVAVKWYEAIQTNLPMCWLAAFGGTMRLSPARRRRLMADGNLHRLWHVANNSQFFFNVYFEEWFTEDIDDLRKEMGIEKFS